MLSTTSMPSPVGELTIGASDEGVRFVLWNVSERDPRSATDGGSPEHREAILGEAVSQLEEYFAGTRTDFDLLLDPHGTPFQQSGVGVAAHHPLRPAVSYAYQARSLGDVRKSRAVGAANGKNPIVIIVPVIESSARTAR